MIYPPLSALQIRQCLQIQVAYIFSAAQTVRNLRYQPFKIVDFWLEFLFAGRCLRRYIHPSGSKTNGKLRRPVF